MKKKTYLLSLLAIALIMCCVLQPALAYFTANAQADGSVPLYFSTSTELKEEVKDFAKGVSIENTGGEHPEYADPVWVRVKAFSGVTYPLEVSGLAEENEEGWHYNEEDEWYYFSLPVEVGESTDTITFTVTGIPDKEDEDHQFAQIVVGVVYETTAVRYAEDGSILPADWTLKLDTGTLSPGNGGEEGGN